MFAYVTSDRAKTAAGGFREWAFWLVAGSRLRRDCSPRPSGLGCTHQDVAGAGRLGGDRTGRPDSSLRLDLATERWAPVLSLVKLEPLTEP